MTQKGHTNCYKSHIRSSPLNLDSSPEANFFCTWVSHPTVTDREYSKIPGWSKKYLLVRIPVLVAAYHTCFVPGSCIFVPATPCTMRTYTKK
jgi:hypothetical protein